MIRPSIFRIKNLFIKKPKKPKKSKLLPPSTTQSKMTLVLDMDETLIHSSFVNINEKPTKNKTYDVGITFNGREFTCYGQCRPYLEIFLERMSQKYELVCFTASDQTYADPILDIIDPNHNIKHRLYRDSCHMFFGAYYVKDLRCLGRSLERTIILDDSVASFVFQIDNGIHIKSWTGNEADQELKMVGDFLENLADKVNTSSNVQQILKEKFKLRDKIFGQ